MEYGWLLLGLRVLVLSAVNPLLKAINRGRSPVIINSVLCLLSNLIILPIAVWQAWRTPGYCDSLPHWLAPGLLSGSIFASGFIMLGRAMGRGDVNLLTPLMSLLFIFVYIEDVALGQRALGAIPLAGIALVMLGVSMLNLRPGLPWRTALSPVFLLKQPGAVETIVFVLAISFTRQIDSTMANQAPVVLYAMAANLPVVVMGFAVTLLRGELGRVPGELAGRWGVMWLAAAVGIANYLTLLASFDYFTPSVIEPASQLAMVLTVCYGVVFFKEPLHQRWLAALIIIAGSVLVIRY
jgi:drug/metabolite transporter (DMT)-like permease